MKKSYILTGMTIVFFIVANAGLAAGPGKARMLSRLPPAVRQAIHQQLGDGRLNSVDKDDEDGELTYDVVMTRAGRQRDFDVSSDGVLLDRQIFLSELPDVLQASIKGQTGRGTPGDIYESFEKDAVSYDVDVTNSDQTRSFTFASDGRLLTREVFLAELPPEVQQAIKKQIGGDNLDEIDESFEDSETSYDVTVVRAGKSRDFSVSLTGELIEEEVFEDELPAVVQAAVRKETSGKKMDDIYKSVDEKDISYDVDLADDSSLTFDEQGNIYRREHPVKLQDAPEAVQTAIQSLAEDGKMVNLKEVTEDNVVSYDTDLYQTGKLKSISFGADGKVIPEDN